MLREALLVHLKHLGARPYHATQLENQKHPVLDGQLEAHTMDSMTPRVSCHMVGPTWHRHNRAVAATVTLHMLLERNFLYLWDVSQWQRRG